MIERLKLLIEHYNLTASSFADKIDVPRSSISHLLSGRNKPSLDFLMKVVSSFDDVNLEWIVYGKGSFPKEASRPSIFSSELNFDTEDSQLSKLDDSKLIEKQDISDSFTANNSPKIDNVQNTPTFKIPSTDKQVLKVMLLFSDGTFEVYNN